MAPALPLGTSHLAKLRREIASADLDIILVDSAGGQDDEADKARAFLAEKQLDMECLFDLTGSAAGPFDARVLPTAFVLSSDGNVRQFLSGKQSERDFCREPLKALARIAKA